MADPAGGAILQAITTAILPILPAITLVIGVGATLLTERLRDRWQSRRELEARVQSRAEQKADRRHRFDLDTLGEAHRYLLELERAALRYNSLERKRDRTGQPYDNFYDDLQEAGVTLHAENEATSRAVRLLLDDDIREACVAVYGAVRSLSAPDLAPNEADQRWTAGTKVMRDATRLVDERILAVYAIDGPHW